jgi:hypothetical protein
LALEKYGGDKLMKTWKDLEKKILDGAIDPVFLLPWDMEWYCTDETSIVSCQSRLEASTKRLIRTRSPPFPGLYPTCHGFGFRGNTRERGGLALALFGVSQGSYCLQRKPREHRGRTTGHGLSFSLP